MLIRDFLLLYILMMAMTTVYGMVTYQFYFWYKDNCKVRVN
jgi:hypothetical protein